MKVLNNFQEDRWCMNGINQTRFRLSDELIFGQLFFKHICQKESGSGQV